MTFFFFTSNAISNTFKVLKVYLAECVCHGHFLAVEDRLHSFLSQEADFPRRTKEGGGNPRGLWVDPLKAIVK